MPIQETCTVAAATRLNEYAYHLVLETKQMAPLITPGQFLHIKCGHSRLLRRPISICHWHEDEQVDIISVVFEVRGEGTEWLARRREGDKLDVLGPLGSGFHIRRDRKYLLVGGGIGVPPLLSCCTLGSTAILGCRSADRAMPTLYEKFEDCCKQVILTSDDGTVGQKGFVDARVREALEGGEQYDALLACGPKPMLHSLVKVAQEFHLPIRVSMEERMACGVGACLGCAVQMTDGTMRHICKDGPVFNGEEVDWNA